MYYRLLVLVTVVAFAYPLLGCTREKPLSPNSTDTSPQDVSIIETPARVSMMGGAVVSTEPESAQLFVGDVTATTTPLPAPATPTLLSASAVPKNYTVQEGDWIYKISRQFGASPDAIVAANPGINPNLLIAGQVLVIPLPGETVPPRSVSTRPAATQPLKAAISVPLIPTATLFLPTAKPPDTSRLAAINPNPVAAKSPAKRYFPPPAWMLGPIQGSAEDEKFITDLFYYLDENKIPITAFHFDSDRWQTCANNGEFRWSESLLGRMRSHNPPVRALFWILPLIGKNCSEYGVAASQGFFVRNGDGSPLLTSSWQGTGSWIDFNNRDAVAYWHSLIDRIFTRAPGVIGGFYTDDIRPDLSNDTAYSDAFVRDLLDYTRSKIPDGDVVMKSYGSNTPDNAFLGKYGHTSYVNDLDSSFGGMREGIRRVFAASSILPAPFNEFTGYAFRVPDTETYFRRLHWGAFQPIMENDSLAKNAVPWDPQYPPTLLRSYQYYSTLHWELVPFFHTYDQLAYQNNSPIFSQPNPAQFSTILGREIFVQYVTEQTQRINVTLPAGQWINYWNEQEVHTGPKTISYPVPFGREPIFIASGAIIPMQVRDSATDHGTTASAGALTVNVFPNGHSTFSYFDAKQKWVAFDVNQAGNRLTLCTSAPPSQPLIYRIARWSSAPSKVTTLDGAVGVDANWGTPLPQLGSEAAVDASGGGWYYDAARNHLIIKLTKLGSGCGG